MKISRKDSHLQGDKPEAEVSNEWPWLRTQIGPDFACDPKTEETIFLKNHYKKAKKIVYWTYFGRNTLEVTLALLGKN